MRRRPAYTLSENGMSYRVEYACRSTSPDHTSMHHCCRSSNLDIRPPAQHCPLTAASRLGCGETDVALLLTWRQEVGADAICTALDTLSALGKVPSPDGPNLPSFVALESLAVLVLRAKKPRPLKDRVVPKNLRSRCCSKNTTLGSRD